ncbi:MAG TPA: SDR family NAD(P)-dependent oxidoreductase [Streptosporangiaceae bacterium]|nr:SDR family NAD(P)-dependent oxidoreductase [Streptosporangiaceae bacterium]
MELTPGKVAVVTGAGSGIGFALAERFARSGLDIVLADVEPAALDAAEEKIAAHGVRTLAVVTDVSDEASVQALASTALRRFGAVHLVCNNAGVESGADAWFGPISAWKWVLGVNLWGVIHGIRAFLPGLIGQGGGHIVNTASIAGLYPGFAPSYDAAKHAVVAISEGLYRSMKLAGLPIGVSVLCPGWVSTNILDAARNWPAGLGEPPPPGLASEVAAVHVRRAIDEGVRPAEVADFVADAVVAEKFWVFTGQEWIDLVVQRWQGIAEGSDPQLGVQVPGLPPVAELAEEIRQVLAQWLGGGQ